MGKESLAAKRIEGVGEGSLAGILVGLMDLMDEAALTFDGAGRILMANEVAQRLFFSEGDLVGIDVRRIFPDHRGRAPEGDFSISDLAFPLDGTSTLCTCFDADGSLEPMMVRCDKVSSPGETYLIVAHPASQSQRVDLEAQRDVESLTRANRRLSGALGIVLDTIDTADVALLFGRVLERITETMEADGTIVYLADTKGFHLRGVSESLRHDYLVRFMSYGQGIERLVVGEGHSVALKVLPPSGNDLRSGRLAYREVVNEKTREIVRLKASLVPPFSAFIIVPVFFGGRVISIFEVGWRLTRSVGSDDTNLLDSIAHYLAIQLMAAFTTMQSKHAEELASLEVEVRERLLTTPVEGQGPFDRLDSVISYVATRLESVACRVMVNEHQPLLLAELPECGPTELPSSVRDLLREDVRCKDGSSVCVCVLDHDSELARFLRKKGEPSEGALLDFGNLADTRVRFLLLRPDDADPFDDVEVDFLERLVKGVSDIASGAEVIAQDVHISQALQLGMRNEIQEVPGITAEAVYSSATASALVGGDFYDLICLPQRRACVIMGDVSGKGIEAASVSAAVKTALGAYAWEGLAPARMVRSLNDFLLSFSRVETFATLFVGIIDLVAATITYCSAGHPPAILITKDAEEISILDVQSGVVGAFPGLSYLNGTAELASGDVLLLYTDGTTEARDHTGAFFGEQGLRDMVMRESASDKPYEGFVDRLLSTVYNFTGQHLEDDVALMSLRIDEVG